MIRAARIGATADARTEPEPLGAAAPVVAAEVAAPVADAESAPAAEEPAPASEPVEDAPEPPASAGEDEPDTATITGVVAEEPIRLEEPEPARSGRSDEKEGDSLKELFWGEE